MTLFSYRACGAPRRKGIGSLHFMSGGHNSPDGSNDRFRYLAARSSAAKSAHGQTGSQETPGSAGLSKLQAEVIADAASPSAPAQDAPGAQDGQEAPKKTRRFIDSREAPVFSRVKAFVVDAVIIFFATTIISGILWRPIQTAFWGRPFISKEAFYDRLAGKIVDPPGAPKYYKMVNFHNEPRYYRDTSFKEKFISFNIDYPLLPIILYFAFMWAAAGASFGQMYANNIVVMCEDDGNPNILEALTRSVIFVFSVGFFGIGALMYFGEDNLTLYDKLCGTKVIEIK